MRSFELDELLAGEDPEATFHDALVEDLHFDARLRTLTVGVQISMYASTSAPRYRAGSLAFAGVRVLVSSRSRLEWPKALPACGLLPTVPSNRSLPSGTPSQRCLSRCRRMRSSTTYTFPTRTRSSSSLRWTSSSHGCRRAPVRRQMPSNGRIWTPPQVQKTDR
jgi:hypothetical protein